MLHIAHASGVFAGIEPEAVTADDDAWRAWATVWRLDKPHGFRYPGRFLRQLPGDNPDEIARRAARGEEMAIKAAEIMALRRAFDVSENVFQLAHPDQIERITELSRRLNDTQRAQASEWRQHAGIDWRRPSRQGAAAAIAYLTDMLADDTGGLGAELTAGP